MLKTKHPNYWCIIKLAIYKCTVEKFALTVVKYFLILLNAWNCELARRHDMLIWSLEVSRLSIVRPTKTTLEDSLIFILLMFKMIDWLVLLTRIINWNFFVLGFNEFILNHFNIFCISYFRSFKIVCRLILQLYICIYLLFQ